MKWIWLLSAAVRSSPDHCISLNRAIILESEKPAVFAAVGKISEKDFELVFDEVSSTPFESTTLSCSLGHPTHLSYGCDWNLTLGTMRFLENMLTDGQRKNVKRLLHNQFHLRLLHPLFEVLVA